jgi:non-specific serine/threonine protein kinase
MIITIGSVVKDNKDNTYKLTEVIGQGGFGTVYKAIREKDSKLFAVKTLLQSFSSDDDFQSFKNEVSLAQIVSGENIINYEYVHNGEIFNELPPYIIMEYANGGTLAQEIEKRIKNDNPYNKEELQKMFLELVTGMKTINEKLVHRDIKPENILISNGVLKISDFGLAKIVNDTTRSKTLKGYGTVKYFAPEAWNSEKNTIQMDIYSMGIIFYELATLEYPYVIKNNDIQEYQNAHLYSSIKNARLLKERTTPEIYSMIIRMIEKATQKRFKTWDDILKHVDNFLVEKKDSLSTVVNKVVQIKTERDIKRQQEIEAEKRKQEEISNFCKLIKSQFESDIYSILNNFVENYNLTCSTTDKCSLQDGYTYNQELLRYRLTIPTVSTIKIECKVVLENSYRHEYTDYFVEERVTMTTLQLNNKNIMCFVDINNDKNGFNLVLLKSDGIYGDWYIVDNKNNWSPFSRNRYDYKNEPFSFNISEIIEVKKSYEATHLYSSKLTLFSEEAFLERLSVLLK